MVAPRNTRQPIAHISPRQSLDFMPCYFNAKVQEDIHVVGVTQAVTVRPCPALLLEIRLYPIRKARTVANVISNPFRILANLTPGLGFAGVVVCPIKVGARRWTILTIGYGSISVQSGLPGG